MGECKTCNGAGKHDCEDGGACEHHGAPCPACAPSPSAAGGEATVPSDIPIAHLLRIIEVELSVFMDDDDRQIGRVQTAIRAAAALRERLAARPSSEPPPEQARPVPGPRDGSDGGPAWHRCPGPATFCETCNPAPARPSSEPGERARLAALKTVAALASAKGLGTIYSVAACAIADAEGTRAPDWCRDLASAPVPSARYSDYDPCPEPSAPVPSEPQGPTELAGTTLEDIEQRLAEGFAPTMAESQALVAALRASGGVRERVEAVAADCELKGNHPPLDPDNEAEIDTRFAYADIGRRLRAALGETTDGSTNGGE